MPAGSQLMPAVSSWHGTACTVLGPSFPSLPLSCPPEGGDLELSNTSKTLYSSEDVSPAFETSVFCKVLLYLREEEGDLAPRTAAFPKWSTHLPHQLYSAPFIIHPRPPHSPLIYPILFVSCTDWMFHTRFSSMLVRKIIGGGIYGRRISWKRECIWSNKETQLRSACATLYVSCSVVEVPVW